MPDTSSDTILGILVLSVFLPSIMAIGYAIYRFKNARMTSAWQPLLVLFEDVQTAGDGGGAAASFLRGRYRGRSFQAIMSPGVEVGHSSDGGGPRFNLFELALLDVPGSRNWSVNLHEGRTRGTEASWTLGADDPWLATALSDAGALATVAALVRPDYTLARHGPVLSYRSRDARLVLHADADDGYAPPAEWVRRALDGLLRLAEINSRLNPPAGAPR